MLKYIIVTAGLAAHVTMAQAQYVKNYKRAADRFYDKSDYNSAALYYEKYLAEKDKSGKSSYDPYQIKKREAATGSHTADPYTEVLYKLAESYRQLQDYSHAEHWYKALLEKDAVSHPDALYSYAISLRANGNYHLAAEELEKFLQTKPAADQKAKAQQELANCNFIEQQLLQPEANVKIEKLNANVNKEGASYAAAWMNPGTLVFTATRTDAADQSATPEHNNALYTTALQTTGFGEAQKMNLAGLSNRQQGVASFTPDGKTIFFTAWSVQANGAKTSSIYRSVQKENGWSPAEVVLTDADAQGASYRQPQVTADGKYLLFASNRAGGQGGFDVWYALLDKNGKPGKPVNFGPAVNTKQDDEAPYYFAPENALVFASKGRTGMGGYDLFVAKGAMGSSFSEAANLGYPVNSVKNDLYFVNRGSRLLEDAIISSDRSSLCCLELLQVHKQYRQYISGMVMDCDSKTPLGDVTVTATTPDGKTVAQQTTNANGYYTLETEAGLAVQVNAVKTAYRHATQQPGGSEGDTLTVGAICLTKSPDPFKGQETLVTHDIRFGYNQSAITEDSYAYLNDVAEYLKAHPGTKLEITAHTDGVGSASFNLQLSQARADACVAYLVHAGIDASVLSAKGLGECCPLEKETTAKGRDIPEAREKNRRVEFKLVKR
jgi:outer membrane protein OmpA-like peptidoglycan-associated protein/Tol biopolymer transport system component